MSKIQINYKSGKTVIVKCESFTVRTLSGEVSEIIWKEATLTPMYVGVDSIESIYEL